MKERLPAPFFYHQLRKFLWGYNQGSLAENGLIFEGAEHLGPLKYDGASAAQSSIVSTVDAFLGVKHQGTDDKFLKEQRHCMIKEHRQLIEWVEKFTPVTETTKHRSEAMAAISKFRTHHLTVVAYYILSQLPPDNKSAATGTGGTPFMTFLKNLRDDCQ
ncbi:hypothetical protein WR25_05845 [Diploscapter pachys]|uniref:Uncharacterized protein n=1 Tax=Diploscapter pachys TaxID=2018661 RepID=A0A2A2L6R6_9BILA|nr:hypothetical protein WR25_05845 [Diploscapter pachys]